MNGEVGALREIPIRNSGQGEVIPWVALERLWPQAARRRRPPLRPGSQDDHGQEETGSLLEMPLRNSCRGGRDSLGGVGAALSTGPPALAAPYASMANTGLDSRETGLDTSPSSPDSVRGPSSTQDSPFDHSQ